MSKLKKGYVQIYTGEGKGKTTAAIGLALRAVGYGLKVYMVQFLKGGTSSELESVKKLYPDFQIIRFEKNRDFFWRLDETEKKELEGEIKKAYNFCLSVLRERGCDILIMDEILGVVSNGILTEKDLLMLIQEKQPDMELIFTGRDASERIIENADLVTEMREIKHYMKKGVFGRKGIEY